MPGKRGGGGGGGGGGGFDIRLFFAHKILAALFVVAIIGWFVAFVAQCYAENNVRAQLSLWFSIVLHFLLIIGFFVGTVTDSLAVSRLQLIAFTAIALVFAVTGTNSLYSSYRSEQALGAGYLLLLIVDIFWLLYLTSEEDTALHSILNISNSGLSSPAGRNTGRYGGGSGGGGLSMGAAAGSGGISDSYNARNNASGYSGNFQSASGYQPAYGQSAADVTTSNGAGLGAPKLSNASMRSRGPDASSGAIGASNEPPSVASHGAIGSLAAAGGQKSGDLPEYGYKARALYAYQANADDPTEISFTKGEVLDIVDNSGKWWQARKPSGETGIVPSNYMQLL